MTRVLVCGGRDYDDRAYMDKILRLADRHTCITLIITGGAPGADQLAFEWARGVGLPCDVYPAFWEEHGKAAGPRRNQKMLDEGKPDMVIAFPGGRGTADMVARARTAGVRVHLIKGEVK